MKSTTLTIINKLGMHARASAKFVNLASQFKSDITIARDGQRANGKSIMGIMMLAAAKGVTIELSADGADEDAAVNALVQLIAERFGEEE
jgi:phosphocarrier protein